MTDIPDEWQLISEVPPPPNQDVLLCGHLQGALRQKVGWWDEDRQKWILSQAPSGFYAFPNPTHWKPLGPGPSL